VLRGEGFGRVTVEAMKVGRPVVGANGGGTVELIRDGWNGLFYRLGDAVDLAT
jgi:glycosyltransferase involved in cell wall biosynthesis